MARWLLAVGLVLGGATAVPAQEALWEIYHEAAARARDRGFPAEAEKLWKSALDAADKVTPPPPGLVMTLDNLAVLYIEQDRRPEAAEALLKALALVEKATPESRGVADRCQKLAEFYQQDEATGGPLAEPYWRRALTLRGKETDLMAVAAGPAFGLYTCYLFQNKLDEAEQILRWCLSVADQQDAKNRASMRSVCLHSQAMIHYKRGKDAEAEAAYAQALQGMEKVCGTEEVALLWTLFRYANFYEMVGRPAQAEPYYRRELAIAEKQGDRMLGKQAECLVSLAHSSQDQGKAKEAKEWLDRGVAAIDRLTGQPLSAADKDKLGALLVRAAEVTSAQARHADAEALGKRAVDLTAQVPHSEQHGAACRALADCYLAQNKLNEAEAQLRHALEIDQKYWGANSYSVAFDLARLAHVARARNQDAEAEKLCKQALAASDHGTGITTRPYLREIYDEYETLLKKLNRADELKKLEARAAELHLPPAHH
jgi:tetratricopeptide (TPR) repeat protein